MVKTWQKFLLKLSPKIRFKLEMILIKIINKDYDWLDIKPISWKNWYFRCRIWWIRVIFIEEEKEIIIYNIWYRWDIYKWL